MKSKKENKEIPFGVSNYEEGKSAVTYRKPRRISEAKRKQAREAMKK